MRSWPVIAAAFILVQCAAAPSDEERAEAAVARVDESYPAKAKVFLDDIDFAPEGGVLHLPIRLDRRSANTVIVHVRTRNGFGSPGLVAGRDYAAINTRVVFRPGDPLVQTVPVRIGLTEGGDWFEATLPTTPTGADKGDTTARLTARAGAPPTRERTNGFRKPRRFQSAGAPSYTLDTATVRWSDGGSAESWSTSLSHGPHPTGKPGDGFIPRPAAAPGSGAALSGGLRTVSSCTASVCRCRSLMRARPIGTAQPS